VRKANFVSFNVFEKIKDAAKEGGGGGGGGIFGPKNVMSLGEAKQILGLKDPGRPDSDELQKRYDHLFNVNDRSKGGSFYLQSKVFRAKERIGEALEKDEEFDNM
jgi:mitochondrial import inner membrane translocase subunit TIM16